MTTKLDPETARECARLVCALCGGGSPPIRDGEVGYYHQLATMTGWCSAQRIHQALEKQEKEG